MLTISLRRFGFRHRSAAEIVAGTAVVTGLVLSVLAGNVRAAAAGPPRVESISPTRVEVEFDGAIGSDAPDSPRRILNWRWHSGPVRAGQNARSASSWSEAPWQESLVLDRPAQAQLLEIVVEEIAPERRTRQVWFHSFLDEPVASLPTWRGSGEGLAKAAGDSVVITGQVLFGDRLFDREGYTGARQLLGARAVELEWRSVTPDTLVAATVTDAQGRFALATLDPGEAGVLWLRTRATDSIAGPYAVVDALGEPHRLALGLLAPAGVDSLDLGAIEVPDGGAGSLAGAVHLLDLVTDALDFLAGPDGPLDWSASGGPVTVRWDPLVPNASTLFDGTVVVVASPAAGSSDAWSDGAVLAAVGHALLAPRGWPVPTDWDWLDLERPAPAAFARALGWTFAGAVQAFRDAQRSDASGAALLSPVTFLVDLPSPPPLGFPISADAGLDLEGGELEPGALPFVPRGQRGAPGLAALLWDLLDATTTADADAPFDDDALEGDAARWFAAADAARALSPNPVYEDLHDAWTAQASAEDGAALTVRAVARTACAVEVDAQEPDDEVTAARLLDPWDQPPLTGSGVRINEIFLGERDGVEIVNRGSAPVDVSGWTLDARRNGFANTPSRTVTLPMPMLLLPGRPVLVLEGTATSARSDVDAPAPNWDVPWTHAEDGAVILRDAAQSAVDFVRWDGAAGADPSVEPIPFGTSFSGRLIAPLVPGPSLARDASFTDTNAAANFSIAAVPTPGWPNVEGARVQTLRPRGDLDHLLLEGTGRVDVHVRRDRDEGAPRLTLASPSADGVAALRSAVGAQSRGAFATLWPAGADTQTVLRLDLNAPAATSTGLQVFAWRPASDFGVFPVRGLRATALGLGIAQDSVRVRWSVRGTTDSLRVSVNGVVVRSLAGSDSSVTLALAQGTHQIRVQPFLADRDGAARETGVYVGLIPCALQTGFEAGEGPVVGLGEGFSVSVGPAYEGNAALRDTPLGADYPASNQAIATISLPVDLTPSATLRFAHAAHLVPDGDLARLELSTDEGLSWVLLAAWDGSAHPVDAGDPADWSDGVLESTDWVEEEISLGAFAGERVRLRWRRTSNEAGTSIGWAIDQLALELGGNEGEYWVGLEGSDVTGCGIVGRPWATLVPALAVARPGDRIVLGPGRHTGVAPAPGAPVPVFAPLPAGVELRGAGSDATVIAAPEGGWGVWSAGVDADSSLTRVAGLRVEGGAIGLVFERTRAELDSVDVIEADTSAVLLAAPLTARTSLFARADVGVRTVGTWVTLDHCTVADVDVGVWLGAEGDSLRADTSLLGRAGSALVRTDAPSASASIECSGLWGTLSPFEGALTVTQLANRNFDPQHCDPDLGLYTLAETSPYLAQPWCGLVGAKGVGCTAPGLTPAPAVPRAVAFAAPQPNPFNPRVRLAWEQPRAARVRMEVFDLRGRRVRVLVDETSPGGRREVVWEGEDAQGRAVASGVYLVQLRVDGESHVQRVALIR